MDTSTLRAFPQFTALSPDSLAAFLREFEEQALPQGAVLIAEGENATLVFLILVGEVEVYKAMGPSEDRLLSVRGPGTLLGEMSLFSERHMHTASVRARTPLRVLITSLSQFDRLLQSHAEIAYAMLRVVSRRLEETDVHDITDLREKNRQLTQAYHELQEAQTRLIEKEKIEHELQLAGKIQQSILPRRLPEHDCLDFGALMVPARVVGGDYYDFIPLHNDQMGIVVADVCDKGMPAALYMALVYSAVRLEAAKQKSPGHTLREVNRHLIDIRITNMYVTLIYGILDLHGGLFTYARAGHPYPLLISPDRRARELVGTIGQPLGLFKNVALDEQEVDIPSGGALLVYSDGFSETIEARPEKPELSPFCEHLLAGGEIFSSQQLCERIWHAAGDEAPGNPPITDDFTLVAVQRQ